MNALQIYALGSPYGIDQLAWSVLEKMESLDTGGLDVSWQAHCLSGCEQLLGHWSHGTVNAAVILDTLIDASLNAFSIRIVSRSALADPRSTLSAHRLSLGASLSLSDRLNLTPRRLRIVALSVPDARMRPPADDMVRRLAMQVRDDVLNYARWGPAGQAVAT